MRSRARNPYHRISVVPAQGVFQFDEHCMNSRAQVLQKQVTRRETLRLVILFDTTSHESHPSIIRLINNHQLECSRYFWFRLFTLTASTYMTGACHLEKHVACWCWFKATCFYNFNQKFVKLKLVLFHRSSTFNLTNKTEIERIFSARFNQRDSIKY